MVGAPKSVTKRRRVSFADDVVEFQDVPTNGAQPERVLESSLRDAPLVDVSGAAGTPQHSLLAMENGDNVDGTVTAFDIAEDIEEGAMVTAEDGVIPAALQRRVLTEADAAAASSSDEDETADVPEKEEKDAWADKLATMPVSVNTANQNEAKRRRTGTTTLSLAQCVARFSQHVRNGETAARAMRRLKSEGDKEHLDSLIDACHTALTHGVLGVYDAPREQLLGAVKWDLCWGEEPSDDVHGKLEAVQMTAWERAGYFAGGHKAWVRPHDASEVPWMNAKETFGKTAQ